MKRHMRFRASRRLATVFQLQHGGNANTSGIYCPRVTKMDAADYMSAKIWQPLGMQHDAFWVIDRPGSSGREIGGAFF